MLCKSYEQLPHPEKYIFIGKLVHVIMNSEDAFKEAKELIERETVKGTLENVTILPDNKIEY